MKKAELVQEFTPNGCTDGYSCSNCNDRAKMEYTYCPRCGYRLMKIAKKGRSEVSESTDSQIGKNCENCFYAPDFPADSYCHRYPCKVYVDADGWCGEFKPKASPHT